MPRLASSSGIRVSPSTAWNTVAACRWALCFLNSARRSGVRARLITLTRIAGPCADIRFPLRSDSEAAFDGRGLSDEFANPVSGEIPGVAAIFIRYGPCSAHRKPALMMVGHLLPGRLEADRSV